jgi:hypothetical protein
MKVDIHSIILDNMMCENFRKEIIVLAEQLSIMDPKLKKVQLYSDYILPDKTYSFMDETSFYYPLTLIYSSQKWKICWIRWKKTVPPPSWRIFTPFVAESIELCDTVPKEFIDRIKNKVLFFSQNKHYAEPEMGSSVYPRRGELNISFVDEVSRQISERLILLSGCNLSPKWSICLEESHVVIVDEIRYLCAKLKNQYANSIYVGVCWKEPYELNDFVTKKDVTFELTERNFDNKISSFERIAEFIQTGGSLFSKKMLDALSITICAPDVDIEICFKKNVDEVTKQEILNCIREYVVYWNTEATSEESEEKIHDFFELDSDSEKVVLIYVDLGMCESFVLENLLKHLYHHYFLKTGKIKNVQKITINSDYIWYPKK